VAWVESSIGAFNVGLDLCCIRRSHPAGAASGCCPKLEVSFASAMIAEKSGALANFLMRHHALSDCHVPISEGCLALHCFHSLIHAGDHASAMDLSRQLLVRAATAASP